jgi:hypothetical protein
MPVVDLAREVAKRYVDALPIEDWARAGLEATLVTWAARVRAQSSADEAGVVTAAAVPTLPKEEPQ